MNARKVGLGDADVSIQESDLAPQSQNGSDLTQDGVRPAKNEVNAVAEGSADTAPSLSGASLAAPYSVLSTRPTLPPTLDNLVKIAREYMPRSAVDDLRKAYKLAEQAHQGQTRGTGHP